MSSAGISGNGSWATVSCPLLAPDDDVDLAEAVVGERIVVAGVPAAALLALDRAERHRLGHGQHRVQVERQVPARVELAAAAHADAPEALLEHGDLLQRLPQLALGADDADERLHALLQIGVDGVRVLVARARRTARAGSALPPPPARRSTFTVPVSDFTYSAAREPGAAAEHDQVGQRVAAEPIGAVHAARHLARREEAGHRGRLRVGVDPDAAHDVVAGRPDLHRLLRDVDVRQLLELVVHRGQALSDVVGGPARVDVEEDAAVRAAPPGLDLGVDGPRHLVARQEVGGAAVVLVLVPGVGFLLVVGRLALEVLGDVVEHEARAFGVLERAAVAAHALGDEDAAHARRPHHPGRVELDALHVDQVGARVEAEGDAVARRLPRVRRELPRLAHAAGGEHDGLGLEEHELAGRAPVAERRRTPGRRPSGAAGYCTPCARRGPCARRAAGACGSSRARSGRRRGRGARSGGRRSRAAR